MVLCFLVKPGTGEHSRSFIVPLEKNPNYWDFDMSYGNCMVSDLEDADLGSLPDIPSVRSIKKHLFIYFKFVKKLDKQVILLRIFLQFASEDSLMNCLEWI